MRVLAHSVPPPFTQAPASGSAPPDRALLARLTREFAATADALDASGAFPHANFRALQAAGLVALVAPAAWGGGGATLAQAREVITAVARGEPATALILVTTQAIRAVEIALQLSGNHGLSRRNPLQRHHRDVLCSRIHTPQNDAVLVAAGRRALAEVAS